MHGCVRIVISWRFEDGDLYYCQLKLRNEQMSLPDTAQTDLAGIKTSIAPNENGILCIYLTDRPSAQP